MPKELSNGLGEFFSILRVRRNMSCRMLSKKKGAAAMFDERSCRKDADMSWDNMSWTWKWSKWQNSERTVYTND